MNLPAQASPDPLPSNVVMGGGDANPDNQKGFKISPLLKLQFVSNSTTG